MRLHAPWVIVGLLLALLPLAALNCSKDDTPPGPSATVLTWNAAPTTVNLAAGASVLIQFYFPDDLSGDPSLSFVTVTGGTVDAYLCTTSSCGPSTVLLDPSATLLAGTTGTQVFVTSPGHTETYYVYITSSSTVTMTLQAIGT